jgi:hypothetical protein
VVAIGSGRMTWHAAKAIGQFCLQLNTEYCISTRITCSDADAQRRISFWVKRMPDCSIANGAIIAADAGPAFLIDDQGDTMRRPNLRTAGTYILIFNFLVATFPQQALAGIISTPAAIAAQENHTSLSRLRELLAREDVRGQLKQLGIDPSVAEQRVNSLTPSEIAQLQPHLDNLPAGGDSLIFVVGVVFVVLIILELVGVIDIFKKF